MIKEVHGFNVTTLANDDTTTYPRAIFQDNEGEFAVAAQQVQAVNDRQLGLYLKANNKFFYINGELIPVAKPLEDWELTFTLDTVESEVILDNIEGLSDHAEPTLTDYYGANMDNVNRHMEVRYLGVQGNLEYSPDGVAVPNSMSSETDQNAAQNPDGYVDYSVESGTHSLNFSSGSYGTKVYKLIYRVEAF